MTDSVELEQHQTRSILNWWWITGGALVTGLSLFSLVISIADIGLNGIVSRVHEQYVFWRDLFFLPIVWIVEKLLPSVRIDAIAKDIFVAWVIFISSFAKSIRGAPRGRAFMSLLYIVGLFLMATGAFWVQKIPNDRAENTDIILVNTWVFFVAIVLFLGTVAVVRPRYENVPPFLVQLRRVGVAFF